MLKGLFRAGVSFPTNRQESIAYTKELADGIKLWIKINVLIVPLAILLWITGVISVAFVGLTVIFTIGCPIIMIFGYSIGCLQYLKPKECYKILMAKIKF